MKNAQNTVIQTKRVYEEALPQDGFRIYVDRIWPRGLSHETFRHDLWAKDIAPSTDLRHWFHESPDTRWDEFCARYMQELQHNKASASLANKIAEHPLVTLLYSSRDIKHNNAIVLQKYLEEQLAKK